MSSSKSQAFHFAVLRLGFSYSVLNQALEVSDFVRLQGGTIYHAVAFLVVSYPIAQGFPSLYTGWAVNDFELTVGWQSADSIRFDIDVENRVTKLANNRTWPGIGQITHDLHLHDDKIRMMDR